jgi:hypothetical protein
MGTSLTAAFEEVLGEAGVAAGNAHIAHSVVGSDQQFFLITFPARLRVAG